MARKMTCCGVVAALLLAFAAGAKAADYETCFAFDPVFVQADQRRVPAAATDRENGAAGSASVPGSASAPQRLSLRAVFEALKALSAELGSPTTDVDGR